MKIPKKLKVGSHTYTIITEKNKGELCEPKYWGKTESRNLKIYLDVNLPTSKQEETLLHEMVHIAFDQAGIDRSDAEEEYLVNAISNQLYAILKDNNLLAK